jgi:predicted metal-dependent enzyme (double-stranded beta helix superfamily)
MAVAGYGLEDFVHDMEGLLEGRPDQARIFDRGSGWLERLIVDPDAVPAEYRVPSGKGKRPNHGTYLLYRGDSGLLVTAVVWGPGDHAAPHDHHTWGMIGVANNTLTETRFRRLDDRSDPQRALLERDRVGSFTPGEVSLLVPDVDEIHQMDNHTDRPTVEVHVYGRDLAGLDRCRYDLETGVVSPFVTGKYDNEE